MRLQYFSIKDITILDLKLQYKTLVKKYHPDNNLTIDTTGILQSINAEYDYILANNIIFKSESEKKKEVNFSEILQDIISKIINFQDITIEIIGTWIWLDGKTYQYKEDLKNLGFKFSGGKKKWYFTTEIFDKTKYKQKSLEDLKMVYGCTEIKTNSIQSISSGNKKDIA